MIMHSRVSGRISTFIIATALSSLFLPAMAQENDEHNTESRATDVKNNSREFPKLVDSSEDDFVVKFKGEVISLRNISKLLHQQNITLPNEKEFFRVILQQKNSTAQSCRGRCYVGERQQCKKCYCDKVCETFGDCCFDFYSRCRKISSFFFPANVECGKVGSSSWSSGIVMRSTCDSRVSASTKDCHRIQRLNFTPYKELPVYSWKHNLTYRSIACARCNKEKNTSFWGLDISCKFTSGKGPDPNITIIKKFLKGHSDCSWKYSPTQAIEKYQQFCVIHDSSCSSKELRMPSAVRQLCALYAMTFTVENGQGRREYRNPHCAFCNTEGRLNTAEKPIPPIVPPLNILLDVSKNIEEPAAPKPVHPTNPAETRTVSHNISLQVLNCSLKLDNCTVIFRNKTCRVFYPVKNQSNQTIYPWNKSFTMVANQSSYDETNFHILCPDHLTRKNIWYSESSALFLITFTGMLFSIFSLCLLLIVYVSFKDLKNLPGRCVISLSAALLLYQITFLSAKKSTEVDVLCKAVAILLHFFILSTFAWMSIMAFDAANTFSIKVTVRRRQPSDTRKIFIKYCIVGWGLPAVIVGLCSVLDHTGTFHIGYGNLVYCWISDSKALTFAMVIPVSATLVFNIVCFTKNIYVIHHLQMVFMMTSIISWGTDEFLGVTRDKKRAANMAVSNRSNASLTLICVKLTTVMGLTWILELAANWKQTNFLRYPSTVLNSLQGFFITLCFVTTKKVRGLVRERFSKRRNEVVKVQASSSRDHRTGFTNVERASGSSPVSSRRGMQNYAYSVSCV